MNVAVRDIIDCDNLTPESLQTDKIRVNSAVEVSIAAVAFRRNAPSVGSVLSFASLERHKPRRSEKLNNTVIRFILMVGNLSRFR